MIAWWRARLSAGLPQGCEPKLARVWDLLKACELSQKQQGCELGKCEVVFTVMRHVGIKSQTRASLGQRGPRSESWEVGMTTWKELAVDRGHGAFRRRDHGVGVWVPHHGDGQRRARLHARELRRPHRGGHQNPRSVGDADVARKVAVRRGGADHRQVSGGRRGKRHSRAGGLGGHAACASTRTTCPKPPPSTPPAL